MKFRRVTCDCCKTTVATGRCKSPTYVLSEVVDQSNVIFLLISKAGRATCGGMAAEPAKDEPRTIPRAKSLAEPVSLSPGGRAGAIIDSCSHPIYRPALDDDFDWEMRKSPFQRNQQLLGETSGFWPKRTANRNGELGAREGE